MTTPKILSRAVVAGLLGLLVGCAGTRDDAASPATPALSEARYRAHIQRLASDEFAGRAPRTEGERKTLAYIEGEFRNAGLEPGVGGSFLQPVPLVEITTHADATMDVRGSGGRLALRYADDMVVWTRRPVPDSRLKDAEVVYAGYGIVAPEYGWNDYAGLDVRGKLVLVLVNDPGFATQDPALFSGNTMTYYGRWTYKFEEAVRQGAAGLLVIHETAPAAYPWAVVRNGAAQPQFDLVLEDPASQRLALEGWVTHEAAGRVLALAGRDYETLKRASAQRGFRGTSLGVTASVGVRNDVAAGRVAQRRRPRARQRATGRGVRVHGPLGPPRHVAGCGRRGRRDLQRRIRQRHGRGRTDRARPRVRRDEAATEAVADVRRRHGRGIRPARQRALRARIRPCRSRRWPAGSTWTTSRRSARRAISW